MNITKKILLGIIGLILISSICGCGVFLAGAGTVGIGMDTIRLERDTDHETAWSAAIETLHELSATITLEDRTNNQIQALLDECKIKILVQKTLQESVVVDVTVRKNGLPKLSVAENIAEQINTKFSKNK